MSHTKPQLGNYVLRQPYILNTTDNNRAILSVLKAKLTIRNWGASHIWLAVTFGDRAMSILMTYIYNIDHDRATLSVGSEIKVKCQILSITSQDVPCKRYFQRNMICLGISENLRLAGTFGNSFMSKTSPFNDLAICFKMEILWCGTTQVKIHKDNNHNQSYQKAAHLGFKLATG